MTNKERHIEISAVSIVLSNEIFDKAYELFNNGNMGGYVYTAYELAEWATECEKMLRKVDWEEVLEKGYKKMSEHSSKHITMDVICWDDAIMNFAHYKYEQAYKKVNRL